MRKHGKKAYTIVVEQVIVELLEISGATGIPGDNIMENLKSLGGEIHRHTVEPFKREFISLIMHDKITHLATIEASGDSVSHIILTGEEMRLKVHGTK